ncbi:MAG: phosphopantetheine-binding protein, partial [Acidobacteriota bacterium]
MPLPDLRQKVAARRQVENELVLAPAFFAALRRRLPRIGRVEVHPKRGFAHNELTAFRYQVVLRLDEAAAPSGGISWLDWREEGLTLASLRQRLEAGGPEVLGLRNVPNARVAGAGAVEPQDLWDLAALELPLPYEVELGWASPGASGSFEAVLRRRHQGDGSRCALSSLLPEPQAAGTEPLGRFTNNPLQGRFARRIAPELRVFLEERLPEHMVPSAFVLLDALPLSPNGKIDRKSLPAPDAGRVESGRSLVAPRNAIEERLAEIWRELLGVKRVGVGDDFFELGGHSLLATQAVSRIREAFGVELPLRTFFEAPSVASVAAAVAVLRLDSG